MWKEFKEFALKGNVMDLAVGVIIAGAFQKIVTSLVNDIIMPCISVFAGNIDYSDLKFVVGDASIPYGAFITTVVDFLIIALSLFIFVRYVNKLNDKLKNSKIEELNERLIKKNKFFKRRNKKADSESASKAVEEPTTKLCPYCLSEINIKASKCRYCASEVTKEKANSDVLEEQIGIDE